MINRQIGLNVSLLKSNNDIDDHASIRPIFYIYKGGPLPRHFTHIRVHKSMKEIPDELFSESDVQEVELHGELFKIGKLAFYNCRCLERISRATGVRIIEEGAFYRCKRMSDIELGMKLERIGLSAFARCSSIRGLNIPSVKIVEGYAFQYCVNMTSANFGERLERLNEFTFLNCYALERIVVPLKGDLIGHDVFTGCTDLANVELVGRVHRKISQLSLQTWTDVMNDGIDEIKRLLASIPSGGKTIAVQRWIRNIATQLDHYTNEHGRTLKDAATLLELSAWGFNLRDKMDHIDDESSQRDKSRKRRKVEIFAARKERRMICGADVVIKNVLPFLQLK